MKKIIIILIILVLSVFLIGNSRIVYNQSVYDIPQDTIKTKTTDLATKKSEYIQNEERTKRMDENLEKMELQFIVMDSLLGKKNTLKIK